MKKLLLIVLIVMIYVVTNGINVIERVLNQEETEQIEQENDESSSYTWTNDVLDAAWNPCPIVCKRLPVLSARKPFLIHMLFFIASFE